MFWKPAKKKIPIPIVEKKTFPTRKIDRLRPKMVGPTMEKREESVITQTGKAKRFQWEPMTNLGKARHSQSEGPESRRSRDTVSTANETTGVFPIRFQLVRPPFNGGCS